MYNVHCTLSPPLMLVIYLHGSLQLNWTIDSNVQKVCNLVHTSYSNSSAFSVLMSYDQYELQQNKKHPVPLNWGTTDKDVYTHLYNTLDLPRVSLR